MDQHTAASLQSAAITEPETTLQIFAYENIIPMQGVPWQYV